MSAFEFILILVAIVAGFAISEILAAWGRLIRARVPVRHSALYCCASFFLLAVIVRFVWLLWALRASEWEFLSFVLTFSSILVLALAAYVIALPRMGDLDVLEHYFAQARPFYVLLAVFIVVWTVASVESSAGFLLQNQEETPVTLSGLLVGRAVAFASLLTLAATKSHAIHWILLAGFVAALIAISFVALPQL